MLKNFRITGKLAIGFGIVLILFGVAVFLSWTSLSAVQSSDIDFLQDVVAGVLKPADELSTTITTIRSEVRNMRFTESEEEVNKALENVAHLRTLIESGKRTYASNPKLVSLANLAEMENILRTSSNTLDRTIAMLRTKKTVTETLAKEIDKMTALLNNLVDFRYKMLTDDMKDPEKFNATRGFDRIRALEDLRYSFSLVVRNYYHAMWTRNLKMMNDIVNQIANGENRYNAYYDSSVDQRVRDMMASGRGAFTTLKNGFNDMLTSFTQTDPMFEQLFKDCADLGNIADKLTQTGLTRITDLTKESFEAIGSSIKLMIALAVAAIVVGLGIAFFIAKSISKPLGRVVELCGNASRGDMSIVRDDFNYDGKDELGDLGDALSDMFASLSTAIGDIRGLAIESHEKSEAMKEDAGKNLDYANNVRGSVSNVVKLMESNSSSLQESNAGTEEMSAASMTSAQAATD